jgi:DNA primase
VDALDEAMSEARAHVRSSPAWAYLLERGIRPWTALVYGLGYGLPNPYVSRGTWQAAQDSMLIRGNGRWLWSGGVVYADPPSRPNVLNCRYIPADQLPAGERDFEPPENHHTWGKRTAPLGAWRINSTTRLLVVVEGLFDFLVFAQAINDRQRADAVAVYTNGAAPSKAMQAWFAERPQYDYLLVRDPDAAGASWAETLKIAVTSGGGKGRLVTPPDKMDPDEAIRAGWWPAGL